MTPQLSAAPNRSQAAPQHAGEAQDCPESKSPCPPVAQSAAEENALRLWVILSRAHAAIGAHAQADAARHGLTIAEFAILEVLFHRGPMLLGEVQKRILVSSGGITFLVDRLAAKGLVERRNCERDRRARYAQLTATGEALVREIFPAHAAALTRAMTGLSTDDQRDIGDALRVLGLQAAATTLP